MELIAVLDNIRSLYNVGSIFRTADALGVKKLYLCGITPLPLDRFGKIRRPFAKVSLGAERSVAWEKAARTGDVLRRLKNEDWYVVFLEQMRGAITLPRFKPPSRASRVALVLGNEVQGISPHFRRLADKIVEIPMLGEKESLNVAVAFGIAAYALTHKV